MSQSILAFCDFSKSANVIETLSLIESEMHIGLTQANRNDMVMFPVELLPSSDTNVFYFYIADSVGAYNATCLLSNLYFDPHVEIGFPSDPEQRYLIISKVISLLTKELGSTYCRIALTWGGEYVEIKKIHEQDFSEYLIKDSNGFESPPYNIYDISIP